MPQQWRTSVGDHAEAIQIIKTKDGINGSKVLHYNGGHIMKDILTADDVRDLPLLVFSVTGKTRGGKSFLLNLMYKYLDYKGNPDWTEGPVPSVFEFQDGVDSTTKGLWICTRIFRRTLKNGTKVGIMLMDSQGLFDGEVTGGESVAMSGVSTILSHIQMFNMMGKITTNDLEQILLHLIPDTKEENQSDRRDVGSGLMFVVRDFVGGRGYGYGLENGRKYIEDEQSRGTPEYQAMWNDQSSAFSNIDCVTFPHPGLEIMSNDFVLSPNLQVLDKKFVSMVNSFFNEFFALENLTPHTGGMTGLKMQETLTKLDGKTADKSLSYYQMYIDLVNGVAMQEAVEHFTANIQSLEDMYKAKQIMDDILKITHFMGQSAIESSSNLKSTLEKVVNEKVVNHMVTTYKGVISQIDWSKFNNDLGLLLGSSDEVQLNKDIIIKDIATDYYSKMAEEETTMFKTFCETAYTNEFYDKIHAFKKPECLNAFLDSSIIPCVEFERTGASKTMLDNIIQQQKLIFGNNINESILSNMYKVKEYFVLRYKSQLTNQNVTALNSALWKECISDIDSLNFRSDSERNDCIKAIANETAPLYYQLFREEVYNQMIAEMTPFSDQDFYNRHIAYKNDQTLSANIVARFPEYDQFSSLGLANVWEKDKQLLKSNISSYIHSRLIKWEHQIDQQSAQNAAQVGAKKAAQDTAKLVVAQAEKQASEQKAQYTVQLTALQAALNTSQQLAAHAEKQASEQKAQSAEQIKAFQVALDVAQKDLNRVTEYVEQLKAEIERPPKKKSGWVRIRDAVTDNLLNNLGTVINCATQKMIRNITE